MGLRRSCYNIPKAKFDLFKGNYVPKGPFYQVSRLQVPKAILHLPAHLNYGPYISLMQADTLGTSPPKDFLKCSPLKKSRLMSRKAIGWTVVRLAGLIWGFIGLYACDGGTASTLPLIAQPYLGLSTHVFRQVWDSSLAVKPV